MEFRSVPESVEVNFPISEKKDNGRLVGTSHLLIKNDAFGCQAGNGQKWTSILWKLCFIRSDAGLIVLQLYNSGQLF